MEQSKADEIERKLNFAHEVASVALFALCRIVPRLVAGKPLEPEFIATLHSCLQTIYSQPDAMRPEDVERLRGWMRKLDDEAASF